MLDLVKLLEAVYGLVCSDSRHGLDLLLQAARLTSSVARPYKLDPEEAACVQWVQQAVKAFQSTLYTVSSLT